MKQRRNELDNVLLYPLATEKAIRTMESENVMTFVVDKKATKADIKKRFENLFKVRVKEVRTQISSGRKKAYIKISPETQAIDVATKLGLM